MASATTTKTTEANAQTRGRTLSSKYERQGPGPLPRRCPAADRAASTLKVLCGGSVSVRGRQRCQGPDLKECHGGGYIGLHAAVVIFAKLPAKFGVNLADAAVVHRRKLEDA